MLINECFSHHRSYLLKHLSDEWHNFAHLNPLGNDVKTEATIWKLPFKCFRSKLNTCRDQRTIKPCPPCFVNLFFKTEPALHALSSIIQKRYLEKFKLAICFGLATFLCYAITFGALMAIWWNGGEEVCRPGAGGGQAAYWCRPLSLDTKTIWKYFR